MCFTYIIYLVWARYNPTRHETIPAKWECGTNKKGPFLLGVKFKRHKTYEGSRTDLELDLNKDQSNLPGSYPGKLDNHTS